MDIFYRVDSPIPAQNASNGGYRSRQDSSGNEDDLIIEEIDARTASFDRAKFNLGIILSRMTEHKTGYFI